MCSENENIFKYVIRKEHFLETKATKICINNYLAYSVQITSNLVCSSLNNLKNIDPTYHCYISNGL